MKPAAAFLFPALVALPLIGWPAGAQTPEKPLTVEDIFDHGSVIGNVPDQLTWSPDGKHLTYLDGGELIDLDPGTGRPHVLVSRAKMATLNETGGTEQDRDRRKRYHEASYLWAPDSEHLLFDSNGRYWYYDLKTGTGVEVGESGEASGDDPKFSPDGKSISFVRDGGIIVIGLRAGDRPVDVAPPPNPANTGQYALNGGVDWVYEEELETRSNYFWSPDSKNIAYLQMNETNVPQYPIEDFIPVHATAELQRYPQPGDRNPDVHVAVVSAHGGRTDWMKIPLQAGDDYIPRFGWADARTLWIETIARDQKHRTIYFADAPSGQWRPVVQIEDAKFLDDDYDVTVDDGYIVLTNWTSGYRQLYLYTYDPKKPGEGMAKLEKQLTGGDFDVSAVYRVDTKEKLVYYASNQGNPLEQQLWQVSFDGTRKQLTTGSGFHDGNFAPQGSAFSDKQSTRMEPPTLRLCQSPGKCNVFWQTHALDSYHFQAPKPLQVKAQDGTALYATLLLPEGRTDKASVPLIVNPYGGPGVQEVVNRWSDDLLFDELLAQHGFAVLHTDNRGGSARGRAFAQFAYQDFGPVQMQDQLTVLDAALAQFPQLDPKRLGWWGWSWGGTFTLYAMTHSDRFRAGVAVAPVTDWRDYDSIYTERYLGLPSQDATVYREDSVVNSAAALHGKLLIAQGMGDDNVHLENTVQFIQQLLDAGLPYDLQIYPRKTHSISGADARTSLYHRILAQFENYLMPPPAAAQ